VLSPGGETCSIRIRDVACALDWARAVAGANTAQATRSAEATIAELAIGERLHAEFALKSMDAIRSLFLLRL